jgi:hypothetical protein
VLLTADGLPKVADFGLAKQLDPACRSSVLDDAGQTRTGTVLGTPSYMAPEQAAGKVKELGPWTDVYALGAILYEALTGRPPFRAASVLDTLEQVRTQEPVPVSRLQPKVPRDLETVCLKCLEKEPRKRYASALDLADDLQRFLDGKPVRARPLGPVGRAWRWCRRHPLRAAAVAAAAVLLPGVLAYLETRPAYLDVRVSPGSARVLLDGQPLALTKGRAVVARGPGRHHLEIGAEEYQSQEQQVILVRGGENTVVVNVELASRNGYLYRTSDPPGAELKVVNGEGKVCAEGSTPFLSLPLPSGTYVLRLHKEMYRPAEVTMSVPAGGRLVKGEVVKLEVDPKFSESALFLAARRKLSEPVDFPGVGPDATVLDFLNDVAERYRLTIDVNEAALKAADRAEEVQQKLKAGIPKMRQISLRSLLQKGLGRAGLTFVPQVKRGQDGFTLDVTTPERAAETKCTILYPVGDLVTGVDAIVPSQLVNAVRQSVGSPRDWAPGASSLGYHPGLKALQVAAPWSVQEGVDDYLRELRQSRLRGQKPRP